MSDIEYIQFERGKWNQEKKMDDVKEVTTGKLTKSLSIDTQYITFLKIGNVYLELRTSEWGSVSLVTKEEIDKCHNGLE